MSTVGPRIPYLRKEATVASMMGNVLLAQAALLVVSAAYYGLRPLLLCLATVAVCFAAECVCNVIGRRGVFPQEASGCVTAVTICLLLPPSAPYWLPVTAGLFAILAAKAPFGGLGRTLFNPAAAGVAFVTVCSPDKVFQYIAPPPGGYPLFEDVHGAVLQAPSAMMAAGLKPPQPPLELLWGHAPGPMGTTAALVLVAGAVFLCSRRIINWETPVSMLLASALYAALFPRIACSPLTSVSYELLTGSLLYCGIFMAADPVTSPRTRGGRWLYGAGAGLMLMLMRMFGAYEQSACFAILLANALVPSLDRLVCSGGRRIGSLYKRQKKLEELKGWKEKQN